MTRKASRVKDKTGEVHGYLTVLRLDHVRGAGKQAKPYWLCKCACGKEHVTRIERGRQSCGCIRAAKNKTRSIGKLRKGMLSQAEMSYVASAGVVYRFYNDSGEISFDEFLLLAAKECFYCGAPPSNSYHVGYKQDGTPKATRRKTKDGEVYYQRSSYKEPSAAFVYNGLDRINQQLLHTKNNVVTCCKVCNMMKTKMSQQEFLAHINRIYTFRGNNETC